MTANSGAGQGHQAWRLTDLARARLAELAQHCGSCNEPVVIVTRRQYGRPGEQQWAEQFACERHGQVFARRYRIEIKPAPPARDDGHEGGRQ